MDQAVAVLQMLRMDKFSSKKEFEAEIRKRIVEDGGVYAVKGIKQKNLFGKITMEGYRAFVHCLSELEGDETSKVKTKIEFDDLRSLWCGDSSPTLSNPCDLFSPTPPPNLDYASVQPFVTILNGTNTNSQRVLVRFDGKNIRDAAFFLRLCSGIEGSSFKGKKYGRDEDNDMWSAILQTSKVDGAAEMGTAWNDLAELKGREIDISQTGEVEVCNWYGGFEFVRVKEPGFYFYFFGCVINKDSIQSLGNDDDNYGVISDCGFSFNLNYN